MSLPTSKKTFLFLACSLSFTLSSPLYAWSNFFRFINNFNFPMTVTITPTLAKVTSNCSGKISNISVNPHSPSCEFEFETAQEHWYDSYKNKGTITLGKQNDPSSYCVYNYDYTYQLVPYSYFDLHSEVFSLQSCHGNLKPSELSVVNDHNQALPRPLTGNLILSINREAAAKSTESFSQADCGVSNGDNCIIASPDMNTRYMNNGSSLNEELRLQAQLDRFEPLNFAQFIGSHNSAISHHYTTSTNSYNMSYSDPDGFLSLTELLNSGVRQIELDIEWYNNAVTICHNHLTKYLAGILCDGNSTVSSAITEIRSWIEKNPDEFIILYLDVNLPLAGYVANLDNDLAKLNPYVFTPAMAKQNYRVMGNTLPAVELSKDILVHQFKKNIIITNDDDTDNLQNSQYVFVKVKNSNQTPLPEVGVDSMLSSKNSLCDGLGKYRNVHTLFPNDFKHYNLLRLNGYRSVFDYISDAGSKEPNEVTDYFTTLNIPHIMNCPINLFSGSMLGFTCDSNNCSLHPTDPRFYAFLWSWELGYPLKNGGSDLAFINPKTGHFANDALKSPDNYAVLCYRPGIVIWKTPDAPLLWYLENIKITNPATAFETATLACQNSKGIFAVPTTAYWMNDVMTVVNARGANSPNILVNYKNVNGQWVPNVRNAQQNGVTVLEGVSLTN